MTFIVILIVIGVLIMDKIAARIRYRRRIKKWAKNMKKDAERTFRWGRRG